MVTSSSDVIKIGVMVSKSSKGVGDGARISRNGALCVIFGIEASVSGKGTSASARVSNNSEVASNTSYSVVVIDFGSIETLVSKEMINKLNLLKIPHLNLSHVSWLTKGKKTLIN